MSRREAWGPSLDSSTPRGAASEHASAARRGVVGGSGGAFSLGRRLSLTRARGPTLTSLSSRLSVSLSLPKRKGPRQRPSLTTDERHTYQQGALTLAKVPGGPS